MDDIRIPDGHSAGAGEHIASSHAGPSDAVKVKFSNFVQLIASHNFEEVMKQHAEEDIVVSSNLLTDLANAHEEEDSSKDKKLPMMLLAGIIVGIVLTYLVLQF